MTETSAPAQGLFGLNWERDKRALISGLAGGVLLGMLVGVLVALLLGGGTKAKLTEIIMKAFQGGVTAIITTTFTYFLINRYLRKRERESDKILVAHMAEVYDRLRDLAEDYRSPDDNEEISELEDTVEWLKTYNASDRAARRRVTKDNLNDLLFQLRSIPTVLQDAMVQLEFIQLLFARIYTLLNVSSPKVALAVPSCIDQLAFDVRADIEILSYGERAYAELERIYHFAGDHKTYQAEIDEVLESIGSAIHCLYDDLDEDFESFRDENIKKFFEETPPYAKEIFDETLNEFQAFREEAEADENTEA